MSILQNLVAASQLMISVLRQQARSRQAQWQSRLRQSVTPNQPGHDDDFQLSAMRSRSPASIERAGRKLLTQPKICVITFTWARQRDGETGLAEGVTLLAAMLERGLLHPQRERKSALEWRQSPDVGQSVSLSGSRASRPDLSGLYQILENRSQRRSPQSGAADQPRRTRSATPTYGHRTGNRIPSRQVDLLDQAKVLAKHLRECPGGWLAGHHLMKSVRWDTLTELPPLDASGRTRHCLPSLSKAPS